MKQMRNSITAGMVLIIVGMIMGGTLSATADTAWTGAGGTTDWHTPGNWDGGVPDGDTDAYITNLNDAVSIDQSALTRLLDIGALPNSGATPLLTINNDLTISNNLHVARTPNSLADVVHNSGTVTVEGEFWMGAGTGATGDGGTGTYTQYGGTLDLKDELVIGADNGIGTFRLVDGTVLGEMMVQVGRRWRGDATFIQEDGVVNFQRSFYMGGQRSTTVGRYELLGGSFTVGESGIHNNNLWIGEEGQGILDHRGGTLTVAEGGDLRIGWGGQFESQNHSGTYTKWGGTTTTVDGDMYVGGRYAVGNLIAVLDQTGFSPIEVEGKLELGIRNDILGDANLGVRLDGGIILNPATAFNIVEATEITGEDWTETPEDLFELDTAAPAGVVRVQLRQTADRGTLDASDVSGDEQVSFAAASYGYVKLENAPEGTIQRLHLSLSGTPAAAALESWEADALAAGYNWLDLGDGLVEVGLLATDSEVYFAWDLSGYTNSDPLAIDGITVIPEPGVGAMLLLGLVVLGGVRRWQRR